ncbi:MAG TPA: hypothetical protein PKM57_00445 [Kiritimatiellia bacterium]|nr:hypothetical protein [Kiritimatiellia bacterium]HPS06419.1 hypothetical protein [Kiritimatiellia bacterium]
MGSDEFVTISAPSVTRTSGAGAVISVTFSWRGAERRLWFSVEEPFVDYLTAERSDGFLVALLCWAMHFNVNLRFTAPVSRKLFFTVTRFLLPTLKASHPWDNIIRIEAPLADGPVHSAGACGTGLSCGVDSLAVVAEFFLDHEAPPPPNRLTHVTFFNAGAHGYGPQYPADTVARLCQERLAHSRACAQALGLPLVFVDSNLMEYLDFAPHTNLVTLCNGAVPLILQRLFGVYYIASSVAVADMRMDPIVEYFDPIILALLGTDTLTFYSAGMTMTRVQKTALISSLPVAHEFLNVCVAKGHNCSHCHKCLRTMMTLDLFGKLPAFKRVFDVDFYMRRRNRLWGKMQALHYHDPLMNEIWDEQARQQFTLPPGFWLQYLNYKLLRVPRSLLRRLKKRANKKN